MHVTKHTYVRKAEARALDTGLLLGMGIHFSISHDVTTRMLLELLGCTRA